MLKKYLTLSSRKIIMDAILINFFIFICAFFFNKIFSFTFEYLSLHAGVVSMLVILEVIAYRKWLRLNLSEE
ncbi:hypothetical protein [Sporosarcina sp. 6E9]|uniref:hypothetical protein n=1 Tax=Sporosarcina sp. 6E9 TaxID=2819235 RepID=UPI001B306C0D|nr:hypothetical protein [Sporosarcina sp. 6E9]